MTIAETITDVADSLMRERGIGPELVDAVVSFALEISREDDYYTDETLREMLRSSAVASFCRRAATRLFELLGTDRVEPAFEYVPEPSLSPYERKRQVYRHSLNFAGDVAECVGSGRRAVWKVKYCNHEFVVTARDHRAEIFQSFQGRYGIGASVEHSKTFERGELERYLAIMCAGGSNAARVQVAIFGQPLARELAEVFACQKAELAEDDEIVRRLRTRMADSMSYYQVLSERLA
jgi:hypothetical protein